MKPEVQQHHYEKFVSLASQGLCSGLGRPEPGKMCVEAVWCNVLGLPHGDDPGCVGSAVRRFKISLNDSRWSSNAARAKGMMRLGIAQIGSDTLDQVEFVKRLAEQLIRRILPIALRAAAKRIPEHAERLTDAALRCEREGTVGAARNARDVARAAAADAAAAAAADADARRDEILSLTAELATEVLIEMKSPGCAYLHLAEVAK